MSNKEELLEQLQGMSEEEASHMRLVFAPEWPSKATSIGEIRKRTGTRPMSAEEFERHFGDLPTDGEG
jgi:phosphopantetheine adenylyltransferase